MADTHPEQIPGQQLNMALGRFEAAAELNAAIHTLKMRAQGASNLPPEQHQQRVAILLFAVHIIEDERNILIQLGISELTREVQTPT